MDVDVLREPAEAVAGTPAAGSGMPNTATRAGSDPAGGERRQRAERGRLDAGAMRLGGPRDERAPERRLPAVVLAGLPARDPLRAVDEVLVEEVGDARRQLVLAALVGAAQVVGERLERRAVVQAVQDRPQVPDGDAGARAATTPGRRGSRARNVSHRNAAGKREADVRRHAERRARGAATASAPSRALHDDDLGLERRRRRLGERARPAGRRASSR